MDARARRARVSPCFTTTLASLGSTSSARSCLVGALFAEAVLLRLTVDARIARLLLRVDLFYGVSAALLILAGIARLIFGAKGWTNYQAEPFFWAKMATFAVIGLLSILPTLTFTRWAKRTNAGAPGPSDTEVKRIRRFVMIEAHLIVLVVLFASLMARGIGAD